jgi:O-antigen/teichoic acid export membrane protein
MDEGESQMNKNKTIFLVLVFFGVSNLAVPAHAYLDAGTGSMLLQLILGGVAGLVVIMKLYWQKFLSFFRKHDSKKVEEELVTENQNRSDSEY